MYAYVHIHAVYNNNKTLEPCDNNNTENQKYESYHV